MSIKKIFTVYDSKAESYSDPHVYNTKGEAIRAFSEAANTSDHPFNKYAEDYTLFSIGEMDTLTGTLTPTAPVSVGNALEFRKQQD